MQTWECNLFEFFSLALPNICKYLRSSTNHSGLTIFKSVEFILNSQRYNSKSELRNSLKDDRFMVSFSYLERSISILARRIQSGKWELFRGENRQYNKTKPSSGGERVAGLSNPKAVSLFCQELSICFIFNYAFKYVVWALRRRRESIVMMISLILLCSINWLSLEFDPSS